GPGQGAIRGEAGAQGIGFFRSGNWWQPVAASACKVTSPSVAQAGPAVGVDRAARSSTLDHAWAGDSRLQVVMVIGGSEGRRSIGIDQVAEDPESADTTASPGPFQTGDERWIIETRLDLAVELGPLDPYLVDGTGGGDGCIRQGITGAGDVRRVSLLGELDE